MGKLREVGADFAATAPSRWVFEAIVRAPIASVFAEVSGDAKGWADWFPGVRDGGQDKAPGLGVRRWVRVGPTLFKETVVAWDEPHRWAFRVDETASPLASALVEEWTFEDASDATLTRWTFAAEPRTLMRVLSPVMRPYMDRLFDRATKNLERRLTTGR